jgi:prepilin-type N-terminal cleavage/methylation domain-containing protein
MIPFRSPSRWTLSHRSHAGFTLVELMFVIVIMGVVSVSVIPAMDNLQGMREGAARDDLVRLIEVAKGKAVASGRPFGIRVDLVQSTLTIVEINSQGSIQIEYDPLTNNNRVINLAALYPGVAISSLTNGDGTTGPGTVWFDYESNPHTRDQSGGFVMLNSNQVFIDLSSGDRVVIYPHSGMVEVQ